MRKKTRITLFILFIFTFVNQIAAKTTLSLLPDKETVRQIVMENEKVKYTLLVDKSVKISSCVEKKTGVDILEDNPPLNFISARDPLWLDDVGYHLFTVDTKQSNDIVSVTIVQKSSYVENPVVITQTFSLANGAELSWTVNLHNTATGGRAYREPLTKRTLVSFPFIQKLTIGNPKNMHYLIPTQGSFFCVDNPDDFIFYFTKSYDPKMPIDIYNQKKGFGFYLHVLSSALEFDFKDKDDFQSKIFTLTQKPDEKTDVISGRISPHPGDWHAAFQVFKEYIRSNFDFTYYQRPIQEKYRQRLISHFTFLYGHDIYDPEKNIFEIDRFLDEGELNFGGYDYMLLWHDYQRMGVDNRDQWEMYEDLPGGLQGLREMVNKAHQRDVQVFIPYKPWDIMNKGKNHFKEEARIAKAIGSDGIFLDTMDKSDISFRDALDAVNPDNVFVSEGRPDLAAAQLVTGSWNQQGNATNKMPNVDLFRFIIPEHNVHNINRGARKRDELILNALFNGTGLIVWEDIFGEINRFSWNERIMIRRYNRIIHENRDAYLTDNPVPLVPDFRDDIYVNAFPVENKCVYPVFQLNRDQVSRNIDNRLIGPFMSVDHPESWHYVDVWNHETIPAKIYNGKTCLIFPEEPTDVMSCIVAMPSNLEIKQNGDFLNISARQPVENASLHINTVDNLTLLQEKQKVISGNTGEVNISELNLDFPYKIIVKLMQDDIMIDQLIVSAGWKNFGVQ